MDTSSKPELDPSTEDSHTETPRPPISEVFGRHSDDLMKRTGIEGASIRGSTICLFIDPACVDRATLPSELEGWPVVIEESGRIVAADAVTPR